MSIVHFDSLIPINRVYLNNTSIQSIQSKKLHITYQAFNCNTNVPGSIQERTGLLPALTSNINNPNTVLLGFKINHCYSSFEQDPFPSEIHFRQSATETTISKLGIKDDLACGLRNEGSTSSKNQLGIMIHLNKQFLIFVHYISEISITIAIISLNPNYLKGQILVG
ncbi:hypothetical protein BDA99DRAFT_569724 [Phascolomyces articulosus]|uniref:Uncharacterized protein n=1 Tax=Phascolomyces articulosus TaxID=60185 RepID=A0AAD5K597_9FUNG|nr:hypothetical protein BDA99DRAFT_569724 [Phascolomyces articulosus]